jgi:hypothetical protein
MIELSNALSSAKLAPCSRLLKGENVLEKYEGANLLEKYEGKYRSASRLALWASLLYFSYAVSAGVAALLNAYELGLLNVVRSGGTIPDALAESLDARQRVVAGVELGIEIVAVVLLLMWVYRISRNTWSLGIERLEYTPGWSVGWFFVPLAGLILPYYVVKELWKANSSDEPVEWRQATASPIVGVWWAAGVASAVIHYSPLRVACGDARMTQFSSYNNDSWLDYLWGFFWGRLLVDIVGIAVSVLTIILVVRLTDLQKRRHAAVGKGAASSFAGQTGGEQG